MQVKNNIKLMREMQQSVCEQECVKAYIIHKPCRHHNGRLKRVIFGVPTINVNNARQPIFFSKEKASAYAKYVCQGGVILKIFIPQSAIIGEYDTLTIKQDVLERAHLQGCYHSVDGQFEYQQIEASGFN